MDFHMENVTVFHFHMENITLFIMVVNQYYHCSTRDMCLQLVYNLMSG